MSHKPFKINVKQEVLDDLAYRTEHHRWPDEAKDADWAYCPGDAPLPREWAERKTNLIHFSDLEKGAHFTVWEEPQIWANDLNTFVVKLQERAA